MALTIGKAPERTIKTLPESILNGILAGHLGHQIEDVKISAKVSPTKKDEATEFDALYALTPEGMALLMGGKLEAQTPAPEDGKDERTDEQKRVGACDHFNYGRILSVRQAVRSNFETSLEGPEKSIAKQAKSLVDGGSFDNMDEAKAFVIDRLKKQGKLAADYAG